jgi:hypothetical protein
MAWSETKTERATLPMADGIGSRVRIGELSLARDEPALESPDSFSSNPHVCGLL